MLLLLPLLDVNYMFNAVFLISNFVNLEQKIHFKNDIYISASGGFAPDPTKGSAPGPRWGTSVPSPRPPDWAHYLPDQSKSGCYGPAIATVFELSDRASMQKRCVTIT